MKSRLLAALKLPRFLFALGESSNFLTLALFALLARFLGVDSYGSFIALTAISGILSEFVTLGFPSLITRTVAIEPRRAWAEVRHALKYQAAMCAPLLLILWSYMGVANFPAEMYAPGFLIGLSLCFKSTQMTLRGVCRGMKDFGTETLFLWIERVGLLVLGVGAVLVAKDLLVLAAVFFIVRCLTFLAFLMVIRRKVNARENRHLVSDSDWKAVMAFAVSGVMASVYYQVDTAMLPVLASAHDAGIYGALYRFVDLVLVLPRLILVVAFPTVVLLWSTDRTAFTRKFHELRRTVTLIGFPVLVVMILTSRVLLTLAFGSEYAVGANALVLLMAGMFFAFQSMLLSQTLKATGREGTLASTLVATVTLNVILNLILIPRYGFIGAAISTVATECVNFLLLYTVVRRAKVLQLEHHALPGKGTT